MHNQLHKCSGTLTLKTNDGYILEAPVVGLSVRVEDDYSSVGFYDDQWGHHGFRTLSEVIFEASLAPGSNYTIKDIGKDITRTLAVKENINSLTAPQSVKLRSALGVPASAKARYDEETGLTTYTWTERIIVDE